MVGWQSLPLKCGNRPLSLNSTSAAPQRSHLVDDPFLTLWKLFQSLAPSLGFHFSGVFQPFLVFPLIRYCPAFQSFRSLPSPFPPNAVLPLLFFIQCGTLTLYYYITRHFRLYRSYGIFHQRERFKTPSPLVPPLWADWIQISVRMAGAMIASLCFPSVKTSPPLLVGFFPYS